MIRLARIVSFALTVLLACHHGLGGTVKRSLAVRNGLGTQDFTPKPFDRLKALSEVEGLTLERGTQFSLNFDSLFPGHMFPHPMNRLRTV